MLAALQSIGAVFDEEKIVKSNFGFHEQHVVHVVHPKDMHSTALYKIDSRQRS